MGNTDLGHYVPVIIIHCTIGSNVLSLITLLSLMKERDGRKEGMMEGKKEDQNERRGSMSHRQCVLGKCRH